VRLESAQPQPDLLLLEVDDADLALLDGADLAPQRSRRRQPALDLRPRRRLARDDGAALLQRGDAADEQAPLAALDHRDVGGALAPDDGGLVDPDEVGAVEVTVGHLDLFAPGVGLAGDPLAVGDGPGEDLAVAQREAHDVGGPEESGRVADDDRHETGHHDEGGGERAAGQPDERLAAAPELAHHR